MFSWAAGSRRAVIWSTILFADWLACELYLAMPKPTTIDIPWDGTVFVGPWAPQSLFAVFADSMVAAFMLSHRQSKARWQFFTFLAVMAMVCLDLVQATASLAGWPPALPQRIYGISLEVLNGVALLFIIGGAVAKGAVRHGTHPKGRFGRLLAPVLRLGMAIGKFLSEPWEPSRRWTKG